MYGYGIALMLTMLGQGEMVANVNMEDPMSMPKKLYNIAVTASGSRLCDPSIRRKQMARFNARYGRRVAHLAAVIAAQEGLGWDPGEVVTSSCLAIPVKRSAARLAEEISAFDTKISKMEHEYGVCEKRGNSQQAGNPIAGQVRKGACT